MQPVIYFLVGMPAVGKYTVAKVLVALTGARLVDNHSIANVIFNLFALDGISPLPEGIFGPVGKVREAVLDALTNLAPRELSYVFTMVLIGDDPREAAFFERMVEVARQRGSVFVPVLVRCQTARVMERAGDESRAARMKWLDPEAVGNLNETAAQFETDHPNTLMLDTTETTPEESARKIVAWAEGLGRQSRRKDLEHA